MRVCAWLLFAWIVPGAGGQCLRDAQNNAICASTQSDSNICGYPYSMFGRPFGSTYYCDDVMVTKTAPDGRVMYGVVLGGASEDAPRQLFFDAQGNTVVFGNTWSGNFPVTSDASQKAYAGPAPSIGTGYPLAAGGDLFVAVLDGAGKLLYATFAGSSGNDQILGIRDAGSGQVEVLVSADRGPLLGTYDLNRRAWILWAQLAIENDVPYSATLSADGTVAVTTPDALYTFGTDGVLRVMVPLGSFGFREVPSATTDASGDRWLVGRNGSRVPIVAKFAGGTVETFRWTLPEDPAGPMAGYAYLQPPFFGPGGLAYFHGSANLQSTTPNALLAAPCVEYVSDVVAVLSSQGEVELLTYVLGPVQSFIGDDTGNVLMVMADGSRIPVDLSQRPKAGCVQDVLRRFAAPFKFGVGQVVRLLGSGFGPATPTVEIDGIAAPILSTGLGAVVFQIPWDTREGDTVPVTVSEQGTRSGVLPIAVRHVAPLLVEPVLNADGSRNNFDSPAPWGSVITLYVTGAGQYEPALQDGQVPGVGSLALPVVAAFQMSGPDPELARVLYAGPAPGYLGLAQINLQLPAARPYSYSSILPLISIGGVNLFVPSIWIQ